MEYLIILIVLFLISLFLQKKYHNRLYQNKKERILIPLAFFITGTAWDSYAVFMGHWTFEKKHLIGINIGLLPLEEYLFFLIVPYFILTLYTVLKRNDRT